MKYEQEQKVIKKSDVDPNLQKKLGNDKLFQFECEVVKDGRLRIGLKEIHKYSPYYYENFYELKDLEMKDQLFKGCKGLEDICSRLKRAFHKEYTVLRQKDNYQTIEVAYEIEFFEEQSKVVFNLERKTMTNKDDGLKFLYEIQKKNIEILDKIKQQCLKNKDDQHAQKLLKLLN